MNMNANIEYLLLHYVVACGQSKKISFQNVNVYSRFTFISFYFFVFFFLECCGKSYNVKYSFIQATSLCTVPKSRKCTMSTIKILFRYENKCIQAQKRFRSGSCFARTEHYWATSTMNKDSSQFTCHKIPHKLKTSLNKDRNCK